MVILGGGCLVVQEGLIMLKVIRLVYLRVSTELWWLWKQDRAHTDIWLAHKFFFHFSVKEKA